MAEAGEQRSVTAYLGLGASLGDRLANLRAALRHLETDGPGIRILAVSPVYESPHMGLEAGDSERFPPHLNCVARVETSLSPEALLARALAAEEAGGRQRAQKWGPRVIDIDLLLYDSQATHSERLNLPHPGIAQRAFVLLPLADLAPDLRLPDGRALADLLNSETIRAQRIERTDYELLL